MRISSVTLIAAAMFGIVMHGVAPAQEAWPNSPVRIVVAVQPGGTTDILGRLLAQKLTERLGQPFVVENRGGGGGAVAAAYVAKAPADGYTLLMTNDQLVLLQSFGGEISYDAVKDFAPVAIMARGSIVLGVHPSVPAKTVKEFIELARANPGKLPFASCGTGTILHLAGILLNQSAGIDLTHVPYRGCGPAMIDIVANQVPSFFTVLGNAVPFEKEGKVRLLGVGSAHRLASHPDLPTLTESGIEGVVAAPWFGLLAAARTPPDIIRKLAKEIAEIMEMPDSKEKVRAWFLESATSTPEEFARIIQSDLDRWSRLVRDANVKRE